MTDIRVKIDCCVAECKKQRKGNDKYCSMHRSRLTRTGSLQLKKRTNTVNCDVCGITVVKALSNLTVKNYCSHKCRHKGLIHSDEEVKNIIIDNSIPVTECGCWIWERSVRANDYGSINYKGHQELAHRVSYKLFNGDIPEGMLVCHKCDTPSCVNPDHLFLGTYSDNAKDMVKKGRHYWQTRS